MPQAKASKSVSERIRPFAGKPGDMADRIDSRSGKPLAPVGWDRVSDGRVWDADCETCKALAGIK